MFIENNFIDHSYLINKKCIRSYYQEIYINLFLFFCLIGLTYAIFNSNKKVIVFSNVNFSLFYLFLFILCFYEFVVSFYNIFFVKNKKIIKELRINKNLEIKLLNGNIVKLTDFKLVLNNDDIRFKNKGSFGEKVYNKYDFKYIGIESKGNFYLLPYKVESKDFLIKLLRSIVR